MYSIVTESINNLQNVHQKQCASCNLHSTNDFELDCKGRPGRDRQSFNLTVMVQ